MKIRLLVRIVFGTTVPKKPETTAERVLFVAIFLGCFMISFEIYTSITKVYLETIPGFKFGRSSFFFFMKSERMIFPMEECVMYLLEYKNVSCILDQPRAELILRNKRDKSGQLLVKYFRDGFPSLPGSTLITLTN